MTFAALPTLLILQKLDRGVSARRADHAIRPTSLDNVLQAILRVGEIDHGLLERLR